MSNIGSTSSKNWMLASVEMIDGRVSMTLASVSMIDASVDRTLAFVHIMEGASFWTE